CTAKCLAPKRSPAPTIEVRTMQAMTRRPRIRSALARLPLVLALAMAGCVSLPPVENGAVPAAPAAFKEGDGRWAAASAAVRQPRGEWWKAFADPVLDGLVARADRSNATLHAAAARLEQARALARSADADRLPQLGDGAGASRQDGLPADRAGSPATLARIGADFSYEVDLFGRLSAASRAAALDAQASAALLHDARLMVQAEVAQAYLAIRALDAEIALVRRTIHAYRGTLDLTERRFRAGDVAEL